VNGLFRSKLQKHSSDQIQLYLLVQIPILTTTIAKELKTFINSNKDLSTEKIMVVIQFNVIS